MRVNPNLWSFINGFGKARIAKALRVGDAARRCSRAVIQSHFQVQRHAKPSVG
jgi:hypothetical protein